MNSRTTRRFRELLAALPAHIRAQARDAYKLFRQNPTHPGLHFKKVNPDPPTYSRIGIGYRALGGMEGDTVIWYWVGSHADYDKLLSSCSGRVAGVEVLREQTVAELKKHGVEFTQDVADHGYGLITYFKAPGVFKVQLYQLRYVK